MGGGTSFRINIPYSINKIHCERMRHIRRDDDDDDDDDDGDEENDSGDDD